jgi:NAD(P)-dependent dehydrogenase (short-subunit alcohol dehydrogenase family)
MPEAPYTIEAKDPNVPDQENAMSEPVALITGAASGIGRALAVALAQRGWAIAALDCREDGLVTLTAELRAQGRRCAWAVADVTRPAELQERIGELAQSVGPIDLLVASAGIGVETSAHELRAADVARVIDVNLIGVTNSIAAVLPAMIQRRRGHLVALSSVASFRGLPRLLAYSASKAGLNVFMQGLRTEVGSLGIDVTTICPGWIRTPMTAPLHAKLRDMLELEPAIAHILHAIETKRAYYAFPRATVWRLRFLNWLPRSWADAMLARMSRQFQK